MDLPSLDVVVPAFDEQAVIAECLDCLLAQGDDVGQIIVVDNGSTDLTAAIVTEYARQHPKVVLVSEPRPGVENARNTGFAATRADIIGRIDADTRVARGWARAARRYLGAHTELAGCCGATTYYDLPWRALTRFFTWLSVFFANQVIAGNYSFYGANMAIRQTSWQAIKDGIKTERDGEIMEDLSLSIAAANIGQKIGRAARMAADVSGRRFRTSPRDFARYNARWWRTYWVYGQHAQALLTRVFGCWVGDILMAAFSLTLRFHDPTTMRWSLENWRRGFGDRGFRG